MALVANVLNGLLQTAMAAKFAPYNNGVVGPQFVNFSTALSAGINTGIVGSTFNTVDVGSVANPGTGVGLAITGLSTSTLSTLMYNNCYTAFGNSAGVRLQDLTDAISASVVTHLAQAVFTSTHTPVYTGTGVVSFALSSMNSGTMALAIKNAAPLFTGLQWLNLCNSVASAIVTHIKAVGTGVVVITGAAPPSPVPGAGVGTGVVS
jgi:hypothetical protein